MNGQRTDIEIVRDMEFAKLDGQKKAAIERYAEETMDAILRPLYPSLDDKGRKDQDGNRHQP